MIITRKIDLKFSIPSKSSSDDVVGLQMSNRQFHELFLRRLVEIKCFETDWTDGGLSLLEQKLNGGMGGGELRASCKLNPEQWAEVRLSCVLESALT